MKNYKLFCLGYVDKYNSVTDILDNVCGKGRYEIFQTQLINGKYYEFTFNFYVKGNFSREQFEDYFFKKLETYGYDDWVLKNFIEVSGK